MELNGLDADSVQAIEDARDGSEVKVEFPKVCPVNTTDQDVELVKEAGEAAWRQVPTEPPPLSPPKTARPNTEATSCSTSVPRQSCP